MTCLDCSMTKVQPEMGLERTGRIIHHVQWQHPPLCIIWLVFLENLIGIEHRRYIMTVRYSSSTAFQMISNIHPQQKTVVEGRWIVEPIFVENEGRRHGTQLQQMVPIAGTAC